MHWQSKTPAEIREALLQELLHEAQHSSGEELAKKFRPSIHGPVPRHDIEGLPAEREPALYADEDGAVVQVSGIAGYDGNSEPGNPREEFEKLRASRHVRKLLGLDGQERNGGTATSKLKDRFR